MQKTVLFCAAALLAATAWGHAPEVNQAEVLRLGNHVQHVNAGPQAAAEDAVVTALAPPASDADKWFITVVTMRDCAACVQLKKDWDANPWLLALANPHDTKASWAHFNVYLADDASQKFRFAGVRITSYPTVLVQPPRTGKFGPPATVVFQGAYGGNPQKLAAEITRAIARYVAALDKRPTPGPREIEQVGVDPPWQPTPKADPQGTPIVTLNLPQIPPADPPPAFPWSAVLTLLTAGASLPAAAALAVWLIRFARAARQATGQPPLVDQALLERVLNLLERWAAAQEKPA